MVALYGARCWRENGGAPFQLKSGVNLWDGGGTQNGQAWLEPLHFRSSASAGNSFSIGGSDKTRWAGSIHVLRTTAGGNPINCFKLVPCKKGTFLENGLVAPMFTGVQEGHCSLQPLSNLRLHAKQCSNNSIRSIACSMPAPTPPYGTRAAKLQGVTS